MIDTAHPSVSSSGCGASTRQDSRPTLAETSALIAHSERPMSFARGAFAGSIALSKDCRDAHDIANTLNRSHGRSVDQPHGIRSPYSLLCLGMTIVGAIAHERLSAPHYHGTNQRMSVRAVDREARSQAEGANPGGSS